ncbi:hypothetical protein MTO96_025442 [Rhipicephalus appendiculatus]
MFEAARRRPTGQTVADDVGDAHDTLHAGLTSSRRHWHCPAVTLANAAMELVINYHKGPSADSKEEGFGIKSWRAFLKTEVAEPRKGTADWL